MSQDLLSKSVSFAKQAQSKPDFVSKMNIALKETAETKYWINLLCATNFLTKEEASSVLTDCIELEKILVRIIKSSRQ